MATFEEFMKVAEISLKDKTSHKRMNEIVRIMRQYKVLHGLTPAQAVEVLQALGPTYVKIGQLASNRSDLLPKAYCDAFEKLRDDANPMPFDVVIEQIDRAYGKSWHEVFASIDPVPLGAASIAQVHKATLLDGTTVAVKVRRPGVAESMAEDIMLMKHLLALGEFASNSHRSILLSLEGFVEEIERTTASEVNFTSELHNLMRFHDELAGESGVTSPVAYPQYSCESVLVMEFVQGTEISHTEELCQQGVDMNALARRVCQSYVTQVLDDGFFHADPHPGNIFVMEGNVIGFIDFGMVGALTPRDLDFLADFAIGFVSRNSDTISHALVTLCGKKFFEHREELKFEIHQMMMQYTGIPIETINFAGAIQNCVDIIVKYKLQIPSGIFMLIKALATLEKFATSLDPSLALAPVIVPYAKEVVKGKYSPRRIASEIYDTLNNYVSFIRDFPNDVSEILYKLKEGKIKHDVILDDNTLFIKTIRMVSRRIAYVIMLIGLFIGSIVLIVFDRDNGYGHFILIATSILILLQMLKWLFSRR